jgi:hypothetical protein
MYIIKWIVNIKCFLKVAYYLYYYVMNVNKIKHHYFQGLVCLAERDFLKIIFQTFLYLFAIKKIG